MHQLAAIQVRNQFDPDWEYARFAVAAVKLCDLLVEGLQSGLGDGALPEQDDAFDDIVIVDDGSVFFANRFAQLSQSNSGRLHDVVQIADSDWRTVLYFHYGGADILRCLHQADSPDVYGLLSELDEPAAGIDVVRDQRLLDLRQGQSVGNQFCGIELNLVFAGRPPERVYVNDVGNGLELVDDKPVVESFEFHHVVLRIG